MGKYVRPGWKILFEQKLYLTIEIRSMSLKSIISAILVVLAIFANGQSFAQNRKDPSVSNTVVTTPCGYRPGVQPEHFAYCSGNAQVSIPLFVEGVGTVWLTHNSQAGPGADLSRESDIGQGNIDSGFGMRWTISPGGSFFYAQTTYGNTTGISSTMYLIDGSGAKQEFYSTGGGNWAHDLYPSQPLLLTRKTQINWDRGTELWIIEQGDTGEFYHKYRRENYNAEKSRWYPIAIVDHAGNGLRIIHQLFGQKVRIKSIKDAYGRQVNFFHTSDGHYQGIVDVGNTTDGSGRSHIFEYNSSNDLTKIILPDQSFWEFTYDTQGLHLITKITDPFGRKTSRTYDLRGTILSETNEAGSINYSYTSSLVTINDSKHTTQFYHDNKGAWTSIKVDGITQQEVTRGIYHRIDSVTNLLGQSVSYQYYNGAEYSSSRKDPKSLLIISEIDSNNKKTEYEYGPDYRLKKINYDNGRQQVEYTRANHTFTTSKAGRISLNQLQSVTVRSVTGATNTETYLYDSASGYLKEVSSNSTANSEYTTNRYGDVLSAKLPDGTEASMNYTSKGTLTRSTINGLTTSLISETHATNEDRYTVQTADNGTVYTSSDILGFKNKAFVRGSKGEISKHLNLSAQSSNISQAVTINKSDYRAMRPSQSSQGTLKDGASSSAGSGGGTSCTCICEMGQLECGGCYRNCSTDCCGGN